MNIHAILLAAGHGTRFGSTVPKQFLQLAGAPILLHSARALAAAGIDQLVVVSHREWVDRTREVLEPLGPAVSTSIVVGGSTRSESTWNALRHLDAHDEDVVLIHDAARPLVTPDVIRRSIEPVAAGLADSAQPVIPVTDTLVVLDGDSVDEIPDRVRFRRTQTPQSFRKGILDRAYRAARTAGDMAASDDCGLVMRHVPGVRIVAVAGDEENLKITKPLDLAVAEAILRQRAGTPEAAGGRDRPAQ